MITCGSINVLHPQSQTDFSLRKWRPSLPFLSTAQSTWSYVHSKFYWACLWKVKVSLTVLQIQFYDWNLHWILQFGILINSKLYYPKYLWCQSVGLAWSVCLKCIFPFKIILTSMAGFSTFSFYYVLLYYSSFFFLYCLHCTQDNFILGCNTCQSKKMSFYYTVSYCKHIDIPQTQICLIKSSPHTSHL